MTAELTSFAAYMSTLVSTTQNGAVYEFGFAATDAPSITGFVARSAETKYGPEVQAMATDGEGHVDSITSSLPAKRKIDGTFSGYITSAFDPLSVGNSFTFLSRFFVIKPGGISKPRKKGEYVEVTIEAESYANVNS